jgi:hypothetical protein
MYAIGTNGKILPNTDFYDFAVPKKRAGDEQRIIRLPNPERTVQLALQAAVDFRNEAMRESVSAASTTERLAPMARALQASNTRLNQHLNAIRGTKNDKDELAFRENTMNKFHSTVHYADTALQHGPLLSVRAHARTHFRHLAALPHPFASYLTSFRQNGWSRRSKTTSWPSSMTLRRGGPRRFKKSSKREGEIVSTLGLRTGVN